MTDRSCTYFDQHRRERCTECGLTVSSCMCSEPDEAAGKRLWSEDGKMLRAIRGELHQHREEFPNNHYLLTDLIGKVGALTTGLAEHSLEGKPTANEVFHLAIKVATVAIRLGIEGDRDFSYEPITLFPEENSF